MKIFKDPSKIKVVQEDTRSKIVQLLQGHEMTIAQISEILNKDHSTIYRHMKKLEKAGFVEVCGEKTDKRFPEKVYRRTDETFILMPDSDDINKEKMNYELRKDSLEMCFKILEKGGYEGVYNEENIRELTDFMVDLSDETVDFLEENSGDMNFNSYAFHVFEIIMLMLRVNRDEEFRKEVEEVVSIFKDL
ncbi:MAG: ArsR/SmtB family transcription factor [Thermoplasmatota archaeon]